MEYSRSPEPQKSPDPVSERMAALDLSEMIAVTFDRTLVRRGAEFVPDLLKAMGHERLVAGMYDISTQLAGLGCSVDVQYFVKQGSSEPPLITLSVRDADGGFCFPNINLRLNPAIPRERDGGDPSKRLTITSEDQESGFDRRYLPPLEIERFSSAAEIRLIIEESHDPDMPYRISPLFSPQAFSEAREHAAVACQQDTPDYSVLYHEVLVPAVAERLHQESPLFGEREVPEIADCGSAGDEGIFKLKSWIPHAERTRPIELTLAVRQDNLGAQVTMIA